MATINMAYDHPQYTVHQNIAMGEQPTAAVPFAKFVAAQPCQIFSGQYVVTTVGTTTTSGVTSFSFVKISGTTTTTAKFVQLSSANTAFVTGTNVLMTSGTGGLAMAQGDIMECLPGTDATLKGAVSYEVSFSPLGNVSQ